MSDLSAQIAGRLAAIWQKSRPVVVERVGILHETHAALAADPSDTEARERGREAAHKLSGILGTFGLPQGSEYAAQIEYQLKSPDPLSAQDLALLAERVAALDMLIASRPSA